MQVLLASRFSKSSLVTSPVALKAATFSGASLSIVIIIYILNQKSDYTLKDIIPDCWDANFQVYIGGPVAPDTLHFVHQVPDKIPGGMQIGDQLYWGGDFESLKVQINKIMCEAMDLGVAMETGIGVGENWLEAH